MVVGQLMSESLFSPLWFRIADRHPQLRSDVQVQRQYVRGELWYVLVNTADAVHYRINQRAYQLIGRCDGRRSLQAIWDALLEELRDAAPTQDEVIRILGQIEGQGLLFYDVSPDAESLQRRLDERNRRGFINPFALRIPLGDPTPLLRKLEWLSPLLFNPFVMFLWAATTLVALSVTASNWTALHAHAVAWMPTSRYLGLAFVAFPVIKALHELGHALAVRRWGGGVHEAGFSLFALVPAPYVNASAASAFRSRFKRVIVSAAGIMVELFLAALALAIWLNVQPGLLSDLAFVTMFIAGVSTLLFNGNPLLTFDGYYVLCDALDLPNLGPRSREWWTGLLRRLIARENVAGLHPARRRTQMAAAVRAAVPGLPLFHFGPDDFLGRLAFVPARRTRRADHCVHPDRETRLVRDRPPCRPASRPHAPPRRRYCRRHHGSGAACALRHSRAVSDCGQCGGVASGTGAGSAWHRRIHCRHSGAGRRDEWPPVICCCDWKTRLCMSSAPGC